MIHRLQAAAATHPGRQRAQNEDALAFDAERGFAVLADGLGGHAAGEVASRLAVGIMIRALAALPRSASVEQVSETLSAAFSEANTLVFATASSARDCAGMGTTLVAACWTPSTVVVAHVGDSRLYRRRCGAFVQLTHDHSWVQQQIDRGRLTPAQARAAPRRGLLTRALGTEPSVECDIQTLEHQADDVYLLCSDGLTDMLEDREIDGVLARELSALNRASETLVREANAHGGRDNISVILAHTRAP